MSDAARIICHPVADRRALPPYGRHVAAVLRDPALWPHNAGTSADGSRLTIWVAIGRDAWAWARPRRARYLLLVCPSGDDPAAYDWRLLAGGQHDPILIARAGDVSPALVHALAAALLRDGVGRVLDPATGDRYMSESRDAA